MTEHNPHYDIACASWAIEQAIRHQLSEIGVSPDAIILVLNRTLPVVVGVAEVGVFGSHDPSSATLIASYINDLRAGSAD